MKPGKLGKTGKRINKKGKARKTRKMKGGNNPFSDIFGMWGTMTYNLSNALSVFTITPPPSVMSPQTTSSPNPGQQFL